MTKTCQYLATTLKCTVVSRKKNGNFVAKWSYYFRHGMDTENRAAIVQKTIPEAVIVDKGDHFRAFRGGSRAGSSTDSYLWVEFSVPDLFMVLPQGEKNDGTVLPS